MVILRGFLYAKINTHKERGLVLKYLYTRILRTISSFAGQLYDSFSDPPMSHHSHMYFVLFWGQKKVNAYEVLKMGGQTVSTEN